MILNYSCNSVVKLLEMLELSPLQVTEATKDNTTCHCTSKVALTSSNHKAKYRFFCGMKLLHARHILSAQVFTTKVIKVRKKVY